MAILQALFAGLAQYAGKILNTAFGWATILLFGKVPARKQTLLSLVALGAVLWIIVCVGIVSPSAATFLLAFSRLPENFREEWGRVIMIGLAVILPPLVGSLARYVVSESRPSAKELAKGALKGYPYTLGLSLSMLVTLIVAPVHKLRELSKRWTSSHVPMVVEPDDYEPVVQDLTRVLGDAGFPVERRKASTFFTLPAKILSFFGGAETKRLIGDRLSLLAGDGLEITLYPSDLVISGDEKRVMRVRAILTERLTVTKAYLTTQKEAHEIEDRIRALTRKLESAGLHERRSGFEELYRIEAALAKLEISYEEWEVLFREKLQAETALLGHAAGLEKVREPAREPGRRAA